jgi:predicted lipid-binding transport protein (Tim44 family)
MGVENLSGGALIGAIIAGIIGFLIFALIAALILAVINRIVNGYWPHYGRTYATVILVTIVAGLINYGIGKGIGVEHFWAREIIAILVTTLVGGVFMGGLVRRKDGSPLGFQRAALAYLILAIIGFLVAVGLRPLQQSMQAKMEARAPATAATAGAPVAPAATVPPPSTTY